MLFVVFSRRVLLAQRLESIIMEVQALVIRITIIIILISWITHQAILKYIRMEDVTILRAPIIQLCLLALGQLQISWKDLDQIMQINGLTSYLMMTHLIITSVQVLHLKITEAFHTLHLRYFNFLFPFLLYILISF